MTFARVPPNTHYRATRLASSGGRWEIGLSPYTHGMRLRMGLAGHPPGVIDFCLGTDPRLVAPALLAALDILESLPEEACPEDIDLAFPWAGTRPDPATHLPQLLRRLAENTPKIATRRARERFPRMPPKTPRSVGSP